MMDNSQDNLLYDADDNLIDNVLLKRFVSEQSDDEDVVSNKELRKNYKNVDQAFLDFCNHAATDYNYWLNGNYTMFKTQLRQHKSELKTFLKRRNPPIVQKNVIDFAIRNSNLSQQNKEYIDLIKCLLTDYLDILKQKD